MHFSSSTISGTSIENQQGENLGKVEDLVVDTLTGKVDYAVVSFGGFLGVGDKLFAVPLQAFRVNTEDKKMILDVPKDRLKDSPGFDKNNWPKHSDAQWTQSVHTYYGI